jgi:competence protein ComEC
MASTFYADGMKAALALSLAVLTHVAAAAAPSRPMRIIAIDVEGGGGTLYITPEGRSLLVDAGWASGPNRESSAPHLAATARRLGLTQIDYLIVTHYHADHVGGVAELLREIPVGTIVDHGANMEPPRPGAPATASAATMFVSYLKEISGRKRRVVKAGDRLQIGSLRVDIVNAATQVARPPSRAGKVSSCGSLTAMVGPNINENDASIGIVTSFGKTRHLNLADTTAAMEKKLVCPVNRIGPIDLMIVSHHGSALSNTPTLLEATRPRVALMGNGATKGGDKAVLKTLAAAPSRPEVWQLHRATRSPEADVDADRIANIEGGSSDGRFALEAIVSADGGIEIVNQRNNFSKSYPPRP